MAGIAPEALERLMAHDWPGSVRELENTIQRALVMGNGDEIAVEDLPDHMVTGGGATEAVGYQAAVEAYKRELIRDTLEKTGGNQHAGGGAGGHAADLSVEVDQEFRTAVAGV